MREVVPCRELYPQVSIMSIPTGYLLAGIERAIIPGMDKYEIRRRKVLELIDSQCGGVHAKFAEKIDRSPSYVGRMLYEEGKKGKKNISDTLIDAIEQKFKLTRGWLDGIGDKELAPKGDAVQIKGLSEVQERAISLVVRMDKETTSAFVALFENLIPDRRKKNIEPNPLMRLGDHNYHPGVNVSNTYDQPGKDEEIKRSEKK